MKVTKFDQDEDGYQRWLKANPDGYVITTVRNVAPTFFSLHRASCRKISQYTKNMASNAFTGNQYIKICSHTTNSLREWIKEHGGEGFTKLCSVCRPERNSDVVDGVEAYYSDLNAKVSHSLRDSIARKKRLADAQKHPKSFLATTRLFKRNPDVIAEALNRANGHCELCGAEAPFKRVSDNSPYLEVHHITPLAENGEDSVDNTLALCPNCHRARHYG